ncbi:amino acid adenylation domain-containing protein [Dickeya dadantii]|uniref:amino acid adenylation domain-containing protein n=1 Tax=Dickeya dadantii TaxID=204038 RepID=UPI0035A93724
MSNKSMEPASLSYGQRALWFQHYANNKKPFNHLSFAAKILSGKDPARLYKALNYLFHQYDSLRMKYVEHDGDIFQQVVHDIDLPLVEIDATALDNSELLANIADAADEPYDLSSGILMKAKLYHCLNGELVLFLGFHHIAVDLWSMSHFIKELGKAFACQHPEEPLWQERLNNYIEFINYQSSVMQGSKGEALLNYWRTELGQDIPVLQLPEDKLRPVNKSYHAASIRFELPEKLEEELRTFAKKQGVSLYPVLLAIYNVLLHKYSAQTDIVVGSPCAGRSRAHFRETFGFFVNILVNRQRVEPTMPFRALVAEINQRTAKHLRKQDYPHAALHQKIALQHDRSRSPFYDVEFVYDHPRFIEDIAPFIQGWNGARLELGELVFESLAFEKRWLERDLQLFIAQGRDKLYCTLSYNQDLFFTQTAQRFVRHFINLLSAAIREPDSTIGSLDCLSSQEREQILQQWNQTKRSYPDVGWGHDWLQRQARETPHRTALSFAGHQLTYQQLDQRIDRLAAVLSARGIMAESMVPVFMHRSVDMVTAIHAIMRAGGAYVPIDPDLPVERIKWMLDEVSANLVLTQKALLRQWEATGIEDTVLVVDDDNLPVMPINSVTLTADNAAYMIYTSGSTGRPKGVVNTHGGIRNRILWMQEALQLTSDDRVLQKTPYSFDVSVWEFLWPFLAGAQLVIARPGGHKDAEYLIDLIITEAVTTLHFVPSMLQLFLSNPRCGECTSLKRVVCSGEVLPVELVRQFYRQFSDCTLYNLYGPTEAAVDVSWWQCRPTDDLAIVPIGYPIANTQLYILDENLNPVPIGVAGELYIAGCQLARGYWNQPTLTAERFIANPFAGRAEQRMYKTGDIARYRDNGEIEYLGRSDFQVKIRGFRIELGEIEARLKVHHQIKDAVVMTYGEGDEKFLCAWLVADTELSLIALREYLSKSLPEYMVPSHFSRLNQLPLSPNGKLDRKALPTPEPDNSLYARQQYVAPTDDIESRLVDIFRHLLAVEHVGIEDDFFLLGGHSLKAMTLIGEINKTLHVKLSINDIFANTQVKALAALIRNCSPSEQIVIVPVSDKSSYPASFAQRRLYMIEQLNGVGTSYNMAGALLVEGVLDHTRLEEAFLQLIQQHESLRTSFAMESDVIVQRIHPDVPFSISTDEVIDAQVDDLITRFVRPFDLGHAPLLRVGVARVGDERHILLFDMHHIISDGVSIALLIDDFVRLYAGEQTLPRSIHYKDFSAWQHQWLSSPASSAEEQYWLETFADQAPVLNLMTDYPRPPVLNFDGSSIELSADPVLSGKLRTLARETGATLYMVMLAAYNVMLAKYSGQHDIVVGSPVACRPLAETQNVIGMFVNTLAMRNTPHHDQTFRTFLHSVKQNAVQAFEHQNYPFEQLVEKLDIPRDASRNPLFDTLFALQNTESGRWDIAGLRFTTWPLASVTAKFDLAITAYDADEQIRFNWSYRTCLFKQATIEQMAGHFINILQQVTENVDVRLEDVNLLSATEQHQLLCEFNNTTTDYPDNKLFHTLFEQQAARLPDCPAVVLGNKQLTYRQLNNKANRLAALLRAKGVRANQPVGIMAVRSIELIVGILGIFKSGGVYLPLDPQLPTERIAYMLEDSHSEFLLMVGPGNNAIPFHGNVIDLTAFPEEEIYCHELENSVQPTDLAYIIYTSGSTGKPKGVMIEHRSFVNFLYAMYDGYAGDIGPGDRGLTLSSISFDVTIFELFLPLAFGACLVLYENTDFVEPRELAQTLIEQAITLTYIPPSLLNEVNDELHQSKVPLVLNKLMVAVEPFKAQALDNYLSLNPAMAILNGYGPTESTVLATVFPYQRGTVDGKYVPIGKPLPNIRIMILNGDRLVPVGVVGELCIVGEGLSRGYLNLPDVTAEKFIASPYTSERMYRTGDLARWLPDGNIEFIGRADFQVKMRGYRIELGEIESNLQLLAGIKKVVVLAWKDDFRGMYLAAYLSYKDGQQPYSVETLREHLAQSLPSYMIPLHFMVMVQIPVTTNGKIDRKKLPRPTDLTQESTQPNQLFNDTEAQLASLWSELLGKVPCVGDDFFESGGHSLLVMRLATRIQERFNIALSARDIFSHPQFSALARLISLQVETARQTVVMSPIRKANAGRVEFPLSFPQQRLWFLDQLNLGGSQYNMTGAWTLQGKVDPHRLEDAFNQVVSRHAILRTRFVTRDGIPYQYVEENSGIEFRYIEKLSDEDIHSHIQQEVRSGFDLAHGSLLRVLLLNKKQKDEEYLLVVNMHHIISDGWSMNILVNEVSAFWQQGHQTKPVLSSLPLPLIQYGDYALWQHECVEQGDFSEQLAYWQQHLGGHKGILALPADKPRSSSGVGRAGEIPLRLNRNELSQLQQLAKHHDCTLYIVLLAAYAVVLQRYSGDNDIVIGTAVANRRRRELEGLIGFFVNTLGLRIDLSEDMPLSSYLQQVKKVVLDGFANEDVPFDMVLERITPPRLPGINPLFQSMFILQTASPATVSLDGLDITPMHLPLEESKFDLFLNLEEVQGELVGQLIFNRDIFHPNRIHKQAEYFTALLASWVKEPNRTLSQLSASMPTARQIKPVLSPQDIRGLLDKLAREGSK